jgi:hypothetical protein
MTDQDTTKSLNWNPVLFKCPYQCTYCPQWQEEQETETPTLHENWREIPDNLAVWVGENTDIFHPDVSDEIIRILFHEANKARHGYLWCTKNPSRYKDFIGKYPDWSYLITTIESDIDHKLCLAEPPVKRFEHLMELGKPRGVEICISAQPICQFTPRFLEQLIELDPHQVSLGPEKRGRNGPWAELDDVLQLAWDLKEALPETLVNVHGRSVWPDSGLVIEPEEWSAERDSFIELEELTLDVEEKLDRLKKLREWWKNR